MIEKMTLEQFQQIKNQLAQLIKEINDTLEAHKGDESYNDSETIAMFLNLYFKIQNQLLEYDLSAIPFEAWQGFQIFSDETHRADFSKTHANIDFDLVGYVENVNFKGCNVRNLEKIYRLNSNDFDEETRKNNPALFLSDSFDEEFKKKYDQRSLTIEDLANLSLEQIEEITKKTAYRRHMKDSGDTNLIIDTLGLSKTLELYRYSKEEYEAIKDILNFDVEHSNTGAVFLPLEFVQQLKTANVSELKRICFDYTKQKIINDQISYKGEYPKLFIKENPDLFLENTNVPPEIKQRFFKKNLNVQDLLNYPEAFQSIPVDNFMMSEERKISGFFKENYGPGKFQELVQKHPDVFKRIAQTYQFDKFSQFLEKRKDAESAFIIAVKKYFLEYGQPEQYTTIRDGQTIYEIPDWLSSMNFQSIGRINTLEDLLNSNDSVIVYDKDQRYLLDTLGIENIKRLDRETFFFTRQGHKDKTDLELFDIITHFFRLNNSSSIKAEYDIDFQHGNLPYEEFEPEFAKLVVAMRNSIVGRFNINQGFEYMNEEFQKKYPELFIDNNAHFPLKEKFYSNSITAGFLHNKEEYLPFLRSKNLSTTLNTNIKVMVSDQQDGTGKEANQTMDFIELYSKRHGNENMLRLLIKYGELLDDLTVLCTNQELNNKEEIEKCVRRALYNKVVFNPKLSLVSLARDPKMKEEYPDLNLGNDAPKRLKFMFYRRELSTTLLRNFPAYLDNFKTANILFGFQDKRLLFMRNIFKNINLETNYAQLEMIEKYQEACKMGVAPEFEDFFKDYEYKNYEEFKAKLEIINTLASRIVHSNSLELYSFKNDFLRLLVNSDNPIEKLNEIEKLFLKNNLPLFAKMYICFDILYPRLDLVKRNHWGFDDNSRVSPQLKDSTVPRVMPGLDKDQTRHLIIYNDLFRIAYRSNERSLIDYLDNLEKGNDILERISNLKYDTSSLTPEELKTLSIFANHLETLYSNTQEGKKQSIKIENMSLEEKLRIFSKLLNKDQIHSLKDIIIRKFCYFAGVKSVQELRELMVNAKVDQARRTSELLSVLEKNGGTYHLEPGDFIRCIGKYDILGSTLNGGNVCKEQLGSFSGTSSSDTTPLDVDLTWVTKYNNDSLRKNNYEFIKDTPTGFNFGNIFIVIKKDNPNINITRDKDGNVLNAPYDPKKIEVFGSHVNGEGAINHWGARTGIAFTDIDYFIYKKNQIIDEKCPFDEHGNVNYIPDDKIFDDLPIIKFEIARNGYYIPVIDFAGKLIFTKEEFNIIRKHMQGLSYYHENDYQISDNLYYSGIEEDIKEIRDGVPSTNKKREKINNLIGSIVREFNLDVKTQMDGDLSPGSIEFIDTGSTGRYTNMPNDGDYDFFLRLDADIDNEAIKERIKEVLSSKSEKVAETFSGDYRFKKVKIDEETTIDIDISFGIKRNKTSYTSDQCLTDRLSTIKKLYPDKYDMVVANIILAKKVLKNADEPVYNNQRKDSNQGGLGGIGIENWILQNGGSFYDAALDFLEHAIDKETHRPISFSEFIKNYEIWDFGENHFTAREENPKNVEEKNMCLFDNFVSKNMNEKGYNKMIKALAKHLGREIKMNEIREDTQQDEVQFHR